MSETPWSHLRNVEEDGAYADFAAWERWMADKMRVGTCHCDNYYTCLPCMMDEWWEDSDTRMRPQLYSIMCGAIDVAVAQRREDPDHG